MESKTEGSSAKVKQSNQPIASYLTGVNSAVDV
jgi:hypothetical protein